MQKENKVKPEKGRSRLIKDMTGYKKKRHIRDWKKEVIKLKNRKE